MVRVKFIRSGAPYGLAYSAGATGVPLDTKRADALVESGVVEILPSFNDLPDDLPGKSKLIDIGFETIDQVKGAELSILPGITKALAKKIHQYISE
jgi:hypothetical protein